jgi:hypothetical protein
VPRRAAPPEWDGPTPDDDPDWFDELIGRVPSDTPLEVLRSIAADATQPSSARVAAIKLLLDTDVDLASRVDQRRIFDLSDVSGEQLDRELAGYFRTGEDADDPEGRLFDKQGQALPAYWEKQTKRRVTSQFKRLVREFDERVRQAAEQLAGVAHGASEADLRSSAGQGQATPLVHRTLTSVDLFRIAEEKQREENMRDIYEEERAQLPPGIAVHIPTGISLDAMRRQWPSYYTRR